MAQPLHLTIEGTNPFTMSEWLWISALISDMEGAKSSHHDRMAKPLYLTYLSKWIWISSLSLGGNLDMENTKLLPEVLKLHYGQWICQHNNYLFLRHNILELHYSSLHHILDIVILHIDILQLFMEDQVLRKLHTTLIVAIYTSSI